jgi:hypothetical protein
VQLVTHPISVERGACCSDLVQLAEYVESVYRGLRRSPISLGELLSSGNGFARVTMATAWGDLRPVMGVPRLVSLPSLPISKV